MQSSNSKLSQNKAELKRNSKTEMRVEIADRQTDKPTNRQTETF